MQNLFSQFASYAWRVRDLTLFEALTGGAFDRLNWQHSGEFDQNFSHKSNARGFARGGEAWAVLELTGTLSSESLPYKQVNLSAIQISTLK